MKKVNFTSLCAPVIFSLSVSIGACSNEPAESKKKSQSSGAVSSPIHENSTDSQRNKDESEKSSGQPSKTPPANPSPTFDVNQLLPTGRWLSECQPGRSDDPTQLSLQHEYIINESFLTKTTTTYDRDSCATNSAMTSFITETSSIRLGEESNVVKQARKIAIKSLRTVLFSNYVQYIDRVNNSNFFGDGGTWDGSLREIFGEQAERDDIFKIVESRLCFGKFEKQSNNIVLVGIDLTNCLTPSKMSIPSP